MNKASRTVAIAGAVFSICTGHFIHAQQQSNTWIDGDGAKNTIDITSGWTAVDISGKETHVSSSRMNEICKALEDPMFWVGKDDLRASIMFGCERWGDIQPKTQIEQVPFFTLINRLLVISAPGTGFGRYRGMKLQSNGTSTVYDAIMLPNDVGKDLSCTIRETSDPSTGLNSEYHCAIKTMSYPAAIAIQKVLVSQLSRLHLEEDQVREHGLAVGDEDNNECAPTGECTHAHMFMSIEKDYKVLAIGARPDFLRNGLEDIEMMVKFGRHSFVERIAPDSGTVEVSIFSNQTAFILGQGRPSAKSVPK